jgi:hypothetical protein
MNALYRIQMTAAPFTHHTKYSDWESVAQSRMLSRLCAFFKAYSRERAWKATRGRLRWPHYLNRFGLCGKIRDRKQGTDIGKYSFVNSAIENRNQLPAKALEDYPYTCKFLER